MRTAVKTVHMHAMCKQTMHDIKFYRAPRPLQLQPFIIGHLKLDRSSKMEVQLLSLMLSHIAAGMSYLHMSKSTVCSNKLHQQQHVTLVLLKELATATGLRLTSYVL